MTNFNKKLASALAVVTLFTCASSTCLTASASNFIGDVNNDNRVDNNDVNLLQRYVVYKDVSINRGNADINGDGNVNIADVVSLKKMTTNNKGSSISCTSKNNTLLSKGQQLTSPDGKYFAIMQNDGNFVVYYKTPVKNIVIWAAYTQGNPGAYLALQQDGNLVIYNSSSRWIWQSKTSNRPFSDYILSLGNDGILRLRRKKDGRQLWSSPNNYPNLISQAQSRVKARHQYSSIDEAAKDFIIAYNGMSVNQNREYGAGIVKVGNKYTFNHIVWGPVRNSVNGELGDDNWSEINSSDAVAYVHTHGKVWNGDKANLVFSPDDMNVVDDSDHLQYAYLGNEHGDVYRYKKNSTHYSYNDYRNNGLASGDLIATYPQYSYLYSNDTSFRQNNNPGIYRLR